MAIDWVTNPQYDAELMRKHHSKSFCDRLADMKLSSSILYGINETALLSLGQGQYTCYVGDEYQSGALHHAILGTGADGPLQANTHYFYQVGDPSQDANSSDALSEIYSFKTPPEVGPNSFPYHLGLIGDLGQTENSMETLDHAAALQPDSILNVGDLSYADGYQPRYGSFAIACQKLQVTLRYTACSLLCMHGMSYCLARQGRPWCTGCTAKHVMHPNKCCTSWWSIS